MKKITLTKFFIVQLLFLLLSGCSVSNSEPTPEFIPGWRYYEIENVSMQLPDTYEVIDFESLPEYQLDAKSNLSIILVAREYATPTYILTSIIIGRDRISGLTTLNLYMDGLIRKLPENIILVSSDTLSGYPFPTGKITTKYYNPEVNITVYQDVYLQFVSGSIYQFSFSTISDNYEIASPLFETIFNHTYIRRDDYTGVFGESYQGLIQLIGVLLIIIAILLNALLKRRRRTDDITPLIIPEDF